ncbi:MAG TPA: glycerophosphodiester phosphodiesterase family protein [candidate division Zixibacteria bacterium]|nr:glycerophosphodiester phosphodiesterase family protein [candidate division Zixibacteria bacterium]
MARFRRIAHRGASGNYPENTRLAFVKALEARADMIELDCQLSGDGHVVVFHDERLRRITGAAGAVWEKSLADLKRLDAGRWFKKSFRGERILTLEEAVEVVAGRADLCIDIKRYPRSPEGIELKSLFILSHYDYLDRTVFSSFDYRCLRRVRELAPEARLGVLWGTGMPEDPVGFAEEIAAASVHVQKELATRRFLERCWEAGLDVYVWTLDDIREIEHFVSLGVQGIFTNYPERLLRLSGG